MTAVILSFACGVLFLQLQPELPGAGWCGLGALFPVFFLRKRLLCLPAALAIGFAWALGLAHLRLAERLAPELEGRDIEVVGIVAGLPAVGERSLRFEFEPEAAAAGLPGKILLSWYRSPFYEEEASIPPAAQPLRRRDPGHAGWPSAGSAAVRPAARPSAPRPGWQRR